MAEEILYINKIKKDNRYYKLKDDRLSFPIDISEGGTGATEKPAAAANIVNGQSIAPSNVAATGSISANIDITASGEIQIQDKTSQSITHKLTNKVDNSIVANIVESSIAQKDYNEGDFFIHENQLKKIKTDEGEGVKTGESFTDENSKPVKIMDELADASNITKGMFKTTDNSIVVKNSNLIRTGALEKITEDGLGISSFQIWDQEDKVIGIIKNNQNTQTGAVQLSLAAIAGANSNSGNPYYNNIKLNMSPNGTRSYEVSDPKAFRTAINAQVEGNYLEFDGDDDNNKRNISNAIYMKNNNINYASVESLDNDINGVSKVFWRDKNNYQIGAIGINKTKNNYIELSIAAINHYKENEEIKNRFNLLQMRVNSSGDCTYGITSKENFRSAIGAAQSSDRRLKSDITPLDDDAVTFINSIEPCVYTINGKRQVGFIAQDVYEADQWDTKMAFETVEGIDGLDDWEKMEDGSPTWKLEYIRIIPPLVATVQKQNKEIENLKEKNQELEERLTYIEEQIK